MISNDINKRGVYTVLGFLLIISTCLLSALLISHLSNVNRLRKDVTDDNYRILHKQFITSMKNCSLIIDRNIQTIHDDVYEGVGLDIGEDEFKQLYHIYNFHHPRILGKGNIVVLRSKISEFRLKKSVTVCHREHIVTLQENMDVIISGIGPLKLRARIPLISYNKSDMYAQMIYKNNITNLMIITSDLYSRSAFMYFKNYTNIDLPNEYCLTSITPVKFNTPRYNITYSIRQGKYMVDMKMSSIKTDIGVYVEMCFDFKGNKPYMNYDTRLSYT